MEDNTEISFNLKGFENNIKRCWQGLQIDLDFCDVTLVADDKQISAHKIIISSCSPVLGNILKLNPHPHPLIYLRNVKYKDLKNLLTFMYQGEVSIVEEDLHTFLEVAKDLKVRGLSDRGKTTSHSNKKENFSNGHQDSIEPIKSKLLENLIKPESEFLEIGKQSNDQFPQIPEDIGNDFESSNILPIHSKNEHQNEVKKEKYSESNLKPSLSKNGSIEFKCEKCDRCFNAKAKLKLHIESVHEGKLYSCTQCSYQGRHKFYIQKHKKSIHDGVSYPCKQCNYKATFKISLKRHIEFTHEGISYPCNQCTYKARQKSNLKVHREVMHKETPIFSCQKCDYIPKTKYDLKMHTDLFHSGA